MTTEALTEKLQEAFSDLQWAPLPEASPVTFLVPVEQLVPVVTYLNGTEGLYFDQLSNLSAVDLGADSDRLQVDYQLYSLPLGGRMALRVEVPKSAPVVPSLSALFATANWHEREAFDLLGIHFEGHPDLRRILLPANWQGHPLRKDYQTQEYFHGVKVDY